MVYFNGFSQWPTNFPARGFGTDVISPSTFDEQLTAYQQIARLAEIVTEIKAKYDDLTDATTGLEARIEKRFLEMKAQIDLELAELLEEVREIVEGAHDAAISFNPTNGTRIEPISKVISDVYDNTRVHAYFALDYDDEGMTAAQYDAKAWTARHYDINAKGDNVWDELGAKA